MSHSKDHSARQEKHVARNGQTPTMKKGGAGHANWGIEGDEVPDLYEYTHQEVEEATTAKADKVKLVDADTFKSMRS
ncbi:hypothetical protein V8B55DRAFT_1537376 [Mucor lusitanicus]|uniref:Hyaluronan/mRNA-binding protein domain-containing protein n=2 Tax=Mucor circinelloides f. lusitanicus TaxID=29924 RepID=A0A168N3B0_MUCCL|nr:hypothetical protein FB192DRAFT_1386114 [Mucor lusitanicus]OAD05721.1 hypothetical protein MUCCIDRAFT_106277 [Mucor lusitanicus CBS 277.49]